MSRQRREEKACDTNDDNTLFCTAASLLPKQLLRLRVAFIISIGCKIAKPNKSFQWDPFAGLRLVPPFRTKVGRTKRRERDEVSSALALGGKREDV